ncbi:hypothetical protein V8E36_003765 [Tilletia maclaganii]
MALTPSTSGEQASSGSWLKKPFLGLRGQRRASVPTIVTDPAGQHAEDHVDDDAGAAPPRRLRPASKLKNGQITPGSGTGSPRLDPQDQPIGLDNDDEEEENDDEDDDDGGRRQTHAEEDEIEEIDAAEQRGPRPRRDSLAHRRQRPKPKQIEFFSPTQPYYWLSNAAPYEIVLDGVKYPTAEHLFQSLKFFPHRPEVARKVRKASTPSEATRTARKHTADVQKGWRRDGLNLVAMRRVMLLKFSQHTELRKALLSTGETLLVNAAPTDVFWGNGGGRGRNEFGKALASVRDVLRTIDRLGAGSGAITV